MTDKPDWRSSTVHEHYADHDRADFAQEFLRRSPDYCKDYEQTRLRIQRSPEHAFLESEGLAGRWGLSFPFRPEPRTATTPCPVVASKQPKRRDPSLKST